MHQNTVIPDNKEEAYQLLVMQVDALLQDEDDVIANLANVAALLYEYVKDINWVGFYLIKKDQLIVGPFQGKVACSRIKLYDGVCGKAVLDRSILNVSNVHAFEGHIACDSASNSELVVPIFINDKIVGVLDIDSPSYSRFDQTDEKYMQMIVSLLAKKLPDTF